MDTAADKLIEDKLKCEASRGRVFKVLARGKEYLVRASSKRMAVWYVAEQIFDLSRESSEWASFVHNFVAIDYTMPEIYDAGKDY